MSAISRPAGPPARPGRVVGRGDAITDLGDPLAVIMCCGQPSLFEHQLNNLPELPRRMEPHVDVQVVDEAFAEQETPGEGYGRTAETIVSLVSVRSDRGFDAEQSGWAGMLRLLPSSEADGQLLEVEEILLHPVGADVPTPVRARGRSGPKTVILRLEQAGSVHTGDDELLVPVPHAIGCLRRQGNRPSGELDPEGGSSRPLDQDHTGPLQVFEELLRGGLHRYLCTAPDAGAMRKLLSEFDEVGGVPGIRSQLTLQVLPTLARQPFAIREDDRWHQNDSTSHPTTTSRGGWPFHRHVEALASVSCGPHSSGIWDSVPRRLDQRRRTGHVWRS
jgi:hypothetical protein